jgi:hypothetical protein
MYVQVIRGRTSDPDALKAQGEKWDEEVRPGAIGYLGVTSGVTADGEAVTIARFEDEESAAQNAARPEQTAWWQEMEKLFDGPVSFAGSSDVHLMLGGGSNDAGFVQVMEGTIADPDAATAFEQATEHLLREARPDLIGSIRVNHGDGRFTEAAYFTSEADARKGEEEEPPENVEGMTEYMENLKIERYLDLTDPVLR